MEEKKESVNRLTSEKNKGIIKSEKITGAQLKFINEKCMDKWFLVQQG